MIFQNSVSMMIDSLRGSINKVKSMDFNTCIKQKLYEKNFIIAAEFI